jgi:hypothetical protein
MSAPARPDTTVPRSPATDEMQRRQRLQAQDGKPLLPPPGIEQLVQGGGIADHRMQEAQAIWAATRKQLAAQPADIAAAERLLFLTMLFLNKLSGSNDDMSIRALLEGALEVFMLPRHRQAMRCFLARRAARIGELQSAEGWLTGCDPGSEDIDMDSAYRVTRAYIDTGHNRPQAVLQTLGGTFEEIAIQDALDPLATVLRANAWERQSQLPNAQQVLQQFMTRGGGSGAVEGVVKAMPSSWYVCQQSIQSARQVVRTQAGSRAAAGGGGMIIGVIILVSGCIPLFILSGSIIGGEFEFPMLFMLIFPVVFGGWGLKMILAARRKKEIAEGGIHGQGTIAGFQPTGTRINHVPVLKFQLQCQVEGHPPIIAFTQRTMQSGQAQGLVGRSVGIIWHPKYPAEVVMEI